MEKILKENDCYFEEAVAIKKSILYPFFDAICLSFDEGLKKPDKTIFERYLEKFNVQADECLYVGGGGNCELEAAKNVGMKAVQAVWYLKEETNQLTKRKAEFENVENPLDTLDII